MKNWRTTICGIVIAVAGAVANYNGQNNWQGYVGCIGVALLGYLAKDAHGPQ